MGAGAEVRLAPARLAFPTHARGRWHISVYDPTPAFRIIAWLLKGLDLVALIEELRHKPWARKLREVRQWENLVTTEGKNYLLSAGLDGGTQTTTWYVGLTDGTPTAAAGDTMASHAGWTEVTAFDETARQAWTGGTAASGSIDNSASKASFTISTDSTTVGGAFLASVSTKSGTTGTLYAVGAFSGGDLALSAGSTLDIQATFSV